VVRRHPITIEDRHFYNGEGIYCGRQVGDIKASPLGNLFKVGGVRTKEESRMLGGRFPAGKVRATGESIEEFDLWLQMQIQNAPESEAVKELHRIARLASERPVTLICWCEPDNCHTQVIRREAIKLLRSNVLSKVELSSL